MRRGELWVAIKKRELRKSRAAKFRNRHPPLKCVITEWMRWMEKFEFYANWCVSKNVGVCWIGTQYATVPCLFCQLCVFCVTSVSSCCTVYSFAISWVQRTQTKKQLWFQVTMTLLILQKCSLCRWSEAYCNSHTTWQLNTHVTCVKLICVWQAIRAMMYVLRQRGVKK